MKLTKQGLYKASQIEGFAFA